MSTLLKVPIAVQLAFLTKLPEAVIVSSAADHQKGSTVWEIPGREGFYRLVKWCNARSWKKIVLKLRKQGEEPALARAIRGAGVFVREKVARRSTVG